MRIKYLLVPALGLLISGCASTGTLYLDKEFNKVTEDQAIYYAPAVERGENDQLIARYYYNNGALFEESEALNRNLNNLQLSGAFKRYSPRGELITEGVRDKDGLYHGRVVAYEHGSIHWEAEYVHGFRTLYTSYSGSGTFLTRLSRQKSDGELVEFTRTFQDYSVHESGSYRGDNKEGVFESFYADGTRRQINNYQDGELHGTQQYFGFANDILIREEHYDQGVKTGLHKNFSDEGKLKRAVKYDPSGSEIWRENYFDNGQVENRTINYSDGNSKGFGYYEDGSLKYERWNPVKAGVPRRPTPEIQTEEERFKEEQEGCSIYRELYPSGELKEMEKRCTYKAGAVREKFNEQRDLVYRDERVNFLQQGLKFRTYDDGSLQTEYLDGKKHGSHERTMTDITVESGQYLNDLKQGRWQYAVLKKESNQKSAPRASDFNYFSGTYQRGKEEGIWYQRDHNGRLLAKFQFQQGKLREKAEF